MTINDLKNKLEQYVLSGIGNKPIILLHVDTKEIFELDGNPRAFQEGLIIYIKDNINGE